MQRDNSSEKKHILVIGGGFGGLAFINKFPRDQARITLLDKRNHHLFQPLLYQVATTGLSAVDVAQPLRSILASREDVQVLMLGAKSVDPEKQEVHTEQKTYKYDYLVIAAGSCTSFFGNDNWAEHVIGLKSLGDARRIRNSVIESLEAAETGHYKEAELERLMTVIIAGGGPTGVEMAGALAELTKRMVNHEFRNIDPRNCRIILVEALDRVLPTYPEELSSSAQKQLEELGVDVRLGEMVKDIRKGEVELEDGNILRGETICWTAGIQGSSLAGTLDVPKTKANKIKVEPDCSLPGHPHTFVIGDMIDLEDANGAKVPGVAQGAMQTGQHVAHLIADEIANTKSTRTPFTYKNYGDMATIGRNRAVANFKGKHLSGFGAWLAWLVIHLAKLVGLRNKIVVLINWITAYVFFRPGARIVWNFQEDWQDSRSQVDRKG